MVFVLSGKIRSELIGYHRICCWVSSGNIAAIAESRIVICCLSDIISYHRHKISRWFVGLSNIEEDQSMICVEYHWVTSAIIVAELVRVGHHRITSAVIVAGFIGWLIIVDRVVCLRYLPPNRFNCYQFIYRCLYLYYCGSLTSISHNLLTSLPQKLATSKTVALNQTGDSEVWDVNTPADAE